MPNGIDRNWVRFCAAVNGFRARYHHWPTKMRMYENAIEFLFKPDTVSKLKEKMKLIYDDSPFIAEDDHGNCYNYADEGFSDVQPDIDARAWLEVSPDSKEFLDYHENIEISRLD